MSDKINGSLIEIAWSNFMSISAVYAKDMENLFLS